MQTARKTLSVELDLQRDHETKFQYAIAHQAHTTLESLPTCLDCERPKATRPHYEKTTERPPALSLGLRH